VELPSAAVALPEDWAAPLRAGTPAVVGRVAEGRLLLDLIAVPARLDATVAAAVRRVAGTG
jgi:L-seryl-tRNA(Ser) seleniumtransferase